MSFKHSIEKLPARRIEAHLGSSKAWAPAGAILNGSAYNAGHRHGPWPGQPGAAAGVEACSLVDEVSGRPSQAAYCMSAYSHSAPVVQVNDPQLQPRLEPRPDSDAVFLHGMLEVGSGCHACSVTSHSCLWADHQPRTVCEGAEARSHSLTLLQSIADVEAQAYQLLQEMGASPLTQVGLSGWACLWSVEANLNRSAL